MRSVSPNKFADDRSYKAAVMAQRKADIARRSGRRGSDKWGVWLEKE